MKSEDYSTIFGTINRPLALAGALRSASSCGSDGRISSGAGDVDHRHGMGGRLDAGHVQFLQFLDVAEDAAKLRAEFFLLVGSELNARKMRDVFDINFSGRHSEKLKSKTQS